MPILLVSIILISGCASEEPEIQPEKVTPTKQPEKVTPTKQPAQESGPPSFPEGEVGSGSDVLPK